MSEYAADPSVHPTQERVAACPYCTPKATPPVLDEPPMRGLAAQVNVCSFTTGRYSEEMAAALRRAMTDRYKGPR